jgi:uncharacterized membrane protein (DUF373 family)
MSEQLAKEPAPAEGDTQAGNAFPQDVPRIFERIEHFTAIGIGALLAVGAVMALAGAVMVSWNAVVHWPQIAPLFRVVDRLLLVLMIIEILHTVRVSIQSHRLAAEPFLIVGMIATIRRILIVTLETADQTTGGQATEGMAISFDRAMIELGVLAGLTLVLAIAIHLSRRARD